MTNLYIILVVLAAAAHFAFLIYLPSGGFLALRWPRTIWLHVPIVVWGVGSVALHWPCPLTSIERWARERAGMGQLPSAGFIDHYVNGVVYPQGATGAVQLLAFAAVVVSWILFAVATARGWLARSSVRS
jgi:hypothetical protein